MTEKKINGATIQSSISNEELDLLPLSMFEGKIHLVQSVEQITAAVDYLKKQPILGFDTETRPSFKKGQIHPVALLQLSTSDEAFLFRVNHIGISPGLVKVLSSPAILKIGAAIHDDIKVLQRIAPFKPNGFIDLQDMAKTYRIENLSLKKTGRDCYGCPYLEIAAAYQLGSNHSHRTATDLCGNRCVDCPRNLCPPKPAKARKRTSKKRNSYRKNPVTISFKIDKS